ncbi:MAG: hypothetical protein RJQ08_01680 [Salinisphaeraceae bacterium]
MSAEVRISLRLRDDIEGLLYGDVKRLPAAARAERLRRLAWLGLLVESGRVDRVDISASVGGPGRGAVNIPIVGEIENGGVRGLEIDSGDDGDEGSREETEDGWEQRREQFSGLLAGVGPIEDA